MTDQHLNIERLSEPEIREKYHQHILKEIEPIANTGWNNIVNICKSATKVVAGIKANNKKSSSPDIKVKAEKRSQLLIKLNCMKNQSEKIKQFKEIKAERRDLKKEIRRIRKQKLKMKLNKTTKNWRNSKTIQQNTIKPVVDSR